jgi:hypothetical protein
VFSFVTTIQEHGIPSFFLSLYHIFLQKQEKRAAKAARFVSRVHPTSRPRLMGLDAARFSTLLVFSLKWGMTAAMPPLR